MAHDAIEGSRLRILRGVGHFPQTEAPEQLLSELLEFLAETPSPPPVDRRSKRSCAPNDDRSRTGSHLAVPFPSVTVVESIVAGASAIVLAVGMPRDD